VRSIIAMLIAFIAGVAGTIWFYSNGGRIIAWGTELGPARAVTVAAPAGPAPRPANAPRPINPVRTIEEEGKPAAPPPPPANASPAPSTPKEAPVPADALNILGVVIVWPDI